ncbi:MAG: mechanosensitive ion channel family protein, partial [Polyangiaceae bacterium]
MLSKLAGKVEGWVEGFIVMLPNLVVALVVVALFSLAAKWVAKLASRLVKRVTNNESFSSLVGTIASVATRIVGVFVALSMLQLDKTVTSLLAGVGVVGLALGFAFQDIAANFMSGIFMAVRRPFKPGDLVEVDGRLARVESVELRSTHVTTTDGLWIQIPNKDVFQNAIINYTKTPKRRMDLSVGVAYSDDLEKARSVATEAVHEIPKRDHEREVELFYDSFGDSSINFVVRVWLESSEQKDYLAARSEAIIAIKKAFDKAQLTIPFPIRTLDFGAGDVGGK